MAYKPKSLTVPEGGTGVVSNTAYAILAGGTTSTSAIQSLAGLGTSGQILTSNGAAALPTFQDNAGGGAPVGAQYVTLATDGTLTSERVLTGTANEIIITDNGAGSTVVLSTPQAIATSSRPTFAGVNLNGRTQFKNVSSTAGNYAVLSTDFVVLKTGITGGGDNVTLPSPGTVGSGAVIIVKDAAGTAGTNNITILPNAAETIDGSANYVMNTNYGSVSILTDGTNWSIF